MAGTWTFLRDGERLQIHQLDRDGVAQLILRSPAHTSRREFQTVAELLVYLTTLEGELIASGWSLTDFHPERRSLGDRRAPREPVTDRRRAPRILQFPTNSAPR